MMKIPMLDLSEQYASLKEEVMQALDEVMSSSRFILGSEVEKIEQDIAKYSHVKHGIGCGNGSDAIHIALQAAGIGEGDEVITTPFTFFATGGAIVRAGAKPVYIDIDPNNFNMDPSKIEAAITENTKAIIPVHLYGQMADMVKIMEVAKRHNLIVIEDAAQAIGAKQGQYSVGELGHAATYSFFPTKNLGAYGDGGMVVTNYDDIAEKSKIIRVHGSKPKYYHSVMGYNSRLDELQAAVLNVKFPHLDKWSQERAGHAQLYTTLLNEKVGDAVKTPQVIEGFHHVFHQYTILTDRRDELQAFLNENGVSSMIYYPVPLHLQPVFEYLGYKEGDMPESEKAAKNALSLPMFPELKEEQQQYVVAKIAEFFA